VKNKYQKVKLISQAEKDKKTFDEMQKEEKTHFDEFQKKETTFVEEMHEQGQQLLEEFHKFQEEAKNGYDHNHDHNEDGAKEVKHKHGHDDEKTSKHHHKDGHANHDQDDDKKKKHAKKDHDKAKESKKVHKDKDEKSVDKKHKKKVAEKKADEKEKESKKGKKGKTVKKDHKEEDMKKDKKEASKTKKDKKDHKEDSKKSSDKKAKKGHDDKKAKLAKKDHDEKKAKHGKKGHDDEKPKHGKHRNGSYEHDHNQKLRPVKMGHRKERPVKMQTETLEYFERGLGLAACRLEDLIDKISKIDYKYVEDLSIKLQQIEEVEDDEEFQKLAATFSDIRANILDDSLYQFDREVFILTTEIDRLNNHLLILINEKDGKHFMGHVLRYCTEQFALKIREVLALNEMETILFKEATEILKILQNENKYKDIQEGLSIVFSLTPLNEKTREMYAILSEANILTIYHEFLEAPEEKD